MSTLSTESHFILLPLKHWLHAEQNEDSTWFWSFCCHPPSSKSCQTCASILKSGMCRQSICLCVACIYEYAGRPIRQTGRTGVQSHDPALTWMKEMVTLLETKQGKGESEGLAGQPLTMGSVLWDRRPHKGQRNPPFPLPHCNRAGISHWPVNIYSIKLLFNLTPGLHRNQDESGRMYSPNWPQWPRSQFLHNSPFRCST